MKHSLLLLEESDLSGFSSLAVGDVTGEGNCPGLAFEQRLAL